MKLIISYGSKSLSTTLRFNTYLKLCVFTTGKDVYSMYQQGTSRSLTGHIVNPGINISYCCVCSNCHLDYLKEIYSSQLTVEKANISDHLADHPDLTFIIDSGGKSSVG